jgi:hypothetical protein
MDDLQESMARVNQISEANNAAPKPDAESKGVKFRFEFDVKMGETGASGDAEEDTEGEQAQEAEDDADVNMSDWNEDEHAPTIRSEVEKAWSKLPRASKQKKTPRANESARIWQLVSS